MDVDLVVRVCVVIAILAVLWVVPAWAAYRQRARRIGRALHLSEPPPPRPAGRPIEQIAADVRRIRGQIRDAPPGMPVARRRGWLEAYDDVLAAACQALGLEERIHALPEGPERDLERERVERLLARSGLATRVPD